MTIEKSMQDLAIEYIEIGKIKPHMRNAKLHPQEQIDQIKASMREMGNGDAAQGFLDPIGVWHGEIVEGHGRYIAAKELGLENVPIIRLDKLTDEQRRAYALIHNKLTMNSDFDSDLLNLELGDITGIDMDDFGFVDEVQDIEFEDFTGAGDGGGSMMATGTRVRVVIGAAMCDIEDPTHEIYAKTKALNPDTLGAWIAEKLLTGELR